MHKPDPVDPETFQKLRELSRYLIQAGQLVSEHIPVAIDVDITVSWNTVMIFTPDLGAFGSTGSPPDGERILAEQFADLIRDRASQFDRN